MRAAAEAIDRLSQGVTPGDVTLAEPRRQDEDAADRKAYLSHELPAEWVAELEKPVPPYETELNDVVDEPERGAETRVRARRAAQAMEELSRGLTLDGLSLQELIGRDRP